MAAKTKAVRVPQPDEIARVELARIRYRTIGRLIEGVFSLGRTVTRAGAWVVCVSLLASVARELAGKDTTVIAVLDAFVKLGANQSLYLIVCALFGVGYWRERRVRKSQSKELGAYARKLELLIDPTRSTSRLTDAGDPAREDRE